MTKNDQFFKAALAAPDSTAPLVSWAEHLKAKRDVQAPALRRLIALRELAAELPVGESPLDGEYHPPGCGEATSRTSFRFPETKT
jgi:hypothetical protein